MLLKSKKAQESLPFEVLIAVILMTFVFLVGGRALKSANEERCFEEINSALNEFKFNLETAMNNAPGSIREFYFKVPSCAGLGEARIRFFTSLTHEQCKSLCQSERNSCYLLSADYKDTRTGGYYTNYLTCIDVPANAVFSGCSALTDWKNIDLGKASNSQDQDCGITDVRNTGLPKNTPYRFVKQVETSDSARLCVYNKSRDSCIPQTTTP